MIPTAAHELAPLLRRFVRSEYGIALGGAHAKGVEDAESDLDLYVFARDILPNAERASLIQQASGNVSNVVSWGDDAVFTQAGTDFHYQGQKVECWLRQAIMEQHLSAAHFWPDNFHYLSAIERCDLIYVTGIVQQVAHNRPRNY